MFDRKNRLYLRRAVIALLSISALVAVVLTQGGVRGVQLEDHWTLYWSMAYLVLGLFFLYLNDRRLVLICFVFSGLLAFLVHEKNAKLYMPTTPTQEQTLPPADLQRNG